MCTVDFTANFVVERDGENIEINDVKLNTTKDKDDNEIISRDFYVQPIKKDFGSFFRQTFWEIFSNTKLTYVSLWKIITGEYGLNAVSKNMILFSRLGLPAYYGAITATILGYSISVFWSLIVIRKEPEICTEKIQRHLR